MLDTFPQILQEKVKQLNKMKLFNIRGGSGGGGGGVNGLLSGLAIVLVTTTPFPQIPAVSLTMFSAAKIERHSVFINLREIYSKPCTLHRVQHIGGVQGSHSAFTAVFFTTLV